MRKEIIDEWHFPIEPNTTEKIIPTAPPEAVTKRDELRDSWLLPHPKSPEIPMVSLGPLYNEQNKIVAYYVRREIIYRP